MSEILGKPYYCTSGDGTTLVAHLYDDSAEVIVQRRPKDGYESADLCKPDAIDLGKRLLEHYDVLPTKEEVDFIETTLLLRKLAMNSKREIEQCTAMIAKLRRLVGEGAGPLCREAPHARPQ